jgi:hypothetical protein
MAFQYFNINNLCAKYSSLTIEEQYFNHLFNIKSNENIIKLEEAHKAFYNHNYNEALTLMYEINPDLLERLYKLHEFDYMIFWAIREKYDDIVQMLVKNNIDQNAITFKDLSPMDYAIQLKNENAIKILNKEKIDPTYIKVQVDCSECNNTFSSFRIPYEFNVLQKYKLTKKPESRYKFDYIPYDTLIDIYTIVENIIENIDIDPELIDLIQKYPWFKNELKTMNEAQDKTAHGERSFLNISLKYNKI